MSLLTLSISLLLMVLQSALSANVSPTATKLNGEAGTCPPREKRDAIIQNITASV